MSDMQHQICSSIAVRPLLKLMSELSEDGKKVTTPEGPVEDWMVSGEQAKKHIEYFVEIHDTYSYPHSEL